jgi:hypothetical protein
MRLMAVLSLLLALFAAVSACEVLARVFLRGGLSDRVEILDQEGGVQADCYPAARGANMTFDLREPGQGVAFFRQFHRMQIGWPGATGGRRENDPIPKTDSAENALLLLQQRAPLCMLYDTRDSSPRFIDEPPGFTHSMAVLGDSFTFGQGVPDAGVLPKLLADKTGWRVKSYAVPGANITEIVQQFAKAMKERSKYRFNRIVYVYVPNDPFVSEELQERTNLLNDLMNVRYSATPYSSRPEVRALGRLAPYSALAAAILRTYSSRVVARRTLRYYQEAHDPTRNPGIISTFDQIRLMHEEARAAGIDFVVVAFPLMLSMSDYPLLDVNVHLAEQAKRIGVPFFDLLPSFRERPGIPFSVHPIDLHPNSAAQEVAATAAAEFLRSRESGSGQQRGVVPNVGRPRAR